MSGLGTLGGLESTASAINDFGQVIGRARTTTGDLHPFLWENGTMVDLGVIQGAGIPLDINNTGMVVGQGENSAGEQRALLWDNGDIIDLGILEGRTGNSVAFGINNNAQIVGQSTSTGGVESEATLWQDGAIFNLNDLINDLNWSLINASAINDVGEIVGIGINPTGDRTTFLLTPTGSTVTLDIQPHSDSNSINCNNNQKAITVAVLTTEHFDATTVDHTTVTFEGATETHVNKKSGKPRRHEKDVDHDGDTDLEFHFRLGDTDLTCESTEGALQGETFDGTLIEGTDSINMVGGTTVITVGQPIP